jgi:4-hydroxy-3-polyprenylbenzoate decarboxylase
MSAPYVIAITGASGAVYARRLLHVLLRSGHDVHLVVSPSGRLVLEQELGVSRKPEAITLDDLWPKDRDRGNDLVNLPREEGGRTGSLGRIVHHDHNDFMAPIASGSYLTGGMVVCPCSGSTLSAVASGAGNNLIHRAADVHLKERRPLILVPRETPLSLVQLDNLRRACQLGAVVLPAMPGWYHGVSTLDDLVDFIVARILDQLRIPHELIRRWGG